MVDQNDEFLALRERIQGAAAEALSPWVGEDDETRDASADAVADAVLDALGLEQVGWLGPYGIVPGGVDVDPAPHWQPVYALSGEASNG